MFRSVVRLTLLALLFSGWFALTQPWVRQVTLVDTGRSIASPEELQRHVLRLSVDFSGRSYNAKEQLEGAAAYISSELERAGLPVQTQTYEDRGRSFRNLVVALGPDTPEVVVVGAHYDVFGEGMPGADDNASGVAGLIELARLVKNLPLRKRVELVAYSTEEPPYFRTAQMGSAVHARGLKARGKQVALMLSLECIGYFDDEPGSQNYPSLLLDLLYPSTGNFVALVGPMADGFAARRVKAVLSSANDLPVRSIHVPGLVVGVDFSDHLNYQAEGFLGMMLTDTAFYRNKAYHTRKDTPDRLDYPRMGKVVDGVKAVVVREAGQLPGEGRNL